MGPDRNHKEKNCNETHEIWQLYVAVASVDGCICILYFKKQHRLLCDYKRWKDYLPVNIKL